MTDCRTALPFGVFWWHPLQEWTAWAGIHCLSELSQVLQRNRGIPPQVIDDAINNIPAVQGKYPDTFKHQSKDVTVIINGNGDVITVFPRYEVWNVYKLWRKRVELFI